MDEINRLIAEKNYGAAWQKAIEAFGEMNYMQFMERFIWTAAA